MYRYDNYTDSFIRIDGEPNTGSTTVRVGVPIKEAVIIEKTELTDECIDKIAEAVVQKLRAEQTEPQTMYYPQVDGITPSVIVKTEPQIEKCPFDDSLPCGWVCTEYGKCKYKPKTEPQTDCSWK